VDRTIPQTQRRTRALRRAAGPVVGVVLGLLAGWYLLGFARPRVDRDRLRTARVEVAGIEATIGATGTVVPRDEQTIVSPIDSRVTRIHHRAGAEVRAGDAILTLDDAELHAELSRLDDRIALERNARKKARLDLEYELEDLRTQSQIKELELASYTFEVQRNRALRRKGLVTIDELRQSETDSARTSLEIRQLARRVEHEERALEVDIERLELEIALVQEEREEAAERLRRASAPASRDGIVTWVLPREGASVQRGTELARVADLSAFAVEARVASLHAEYVHAGQAVRVRLGAERLGGRVVRVQPTIEQGSFVVEVALEQPDHPSLRHNARVEVEIVTEERPRTLVMRRGGVVRHDGRQHYFTVRGDRLVRTPVVLGVSNLESTEILEGLEAGDEVVLSDMARHSQDREVFLK